MGEFEYNKDVASEISVCFLNQRWKNQNPVRIDKRQDRQHTHVSMLLHDETAYAYRHAVTQQDSRRLQACCYIARQHTHASMLLHDKTAYTCRHAVTWRESTHMQAYYYTMRQHTHASMLFHNESTHACKHAVTWQDSTHMQACCYTMRQHTHAGMLLWSVFIANLSGFESPKSCPFGSVWEHVPREF